MYPLSLSLSLCLIPISDDGIFNIVSSSLHTTGVDAKSVVSISDALQVTHEYNPSPDTENLYHVKITYKNMLSHDTLTELRYRRVVDWDIPPDTMNECVSIFFNNVPNSLEYVTDDGFESINPLDDVSNSGILFECPFGEGCPVYDSGPQDHGALLQFLFKNSDGSLIDLDPGDTFSFDMFYGAASSKIEANDALSKVSAEIASFGYPPSGYACNADSPGSPNTFILGFRGVGGNCKWIVFNIYMWSLMMICILFVHRIACSLALFIPFPLILFLPFCTFISYKDTNILAIRLSNTSTNKSTN